MKVRKKRGGTPLANGQKKGRPKGGQIQTIHTLKQTKLFPSGIEQHVGQANLEHTVLDAAAAAAAVICNIGKTNIVTDVNSQLCRRDLEARANSPGEIRRLEARFVILAATACLGFGADQDADLRTRLKIQPNRQFVLYEDRDVKVSLRLRAAVGGAAIVNGLLESLPRINQFRLQEKVIGEAKTEEYATIETHQRARADTLGTITADVCKVGACFHA
jgi:hypothetical protein